MKPENKTKKVNKVWGHEHWLVNTDKYCGKILTLNPGYVCSYHYHKNKDETFYVLSGLVYLNLEGKDIIMKPGDTRRIMPKQKHKFASLKDQSKMIEISTHHKEEDSYRDTKSGPIDLDELRKKLRL